MTGHNTTSIPMTPAIRRVYQLSSLVWIMVAFALGLSALGSTLLRALDPAREIVVLLSLLAGIGMLVRMLAPTHPQWTRWTLPLVGFISVSTFMLTLFAVEFVNGGYTSARVGFALLVLTPAAFAYVSWIGEKVVSLRYE